MKEFRYIAYLSIFSTVLVLGIQNRDTTVIDANGLKKNPNSVQIIEGGFNQNWRNKQERFVEERVDLISQNIFDVKMRDFSIQENESEFEFITRATFEIYQKTKHCNYVSIDNFTTDLSPSPTYTQGYLGLDHVPCGLCSQRSFWLASILKNNYIESEMIGLNGHVVVLVKRQEDDKKIIFDPDYGVVGIPYEVENPKNFRENIFKAYRNKFQFPYITVGLNDLVEIYLSYEDNKILDLDPLFSLYLSQNEFLKSDVFRDQFKRDFHYELEEFAIKDDSQLELLAKYINTALISNELHQEFYTDKISEFYKS